VKRQTSADNRPAPENIFREIQNLRKLASFPDRPNSICRYFTHWETYGRRGKCYLAMERWQCGWASVSKPMNMRQYVTRILYPGNMDEKALFQQLISEGTVDKNDFLNGQHQVDRLERMKIIRRIFARIVDAIAWLHSKQVAHLSLCLTAIMIAGGTEDDPLIKITDFGVAYDYSEEKCDHSRHNRYVGKPRYMAPEVEVLEELLKLNEPGDGVDRFAVNLELIALEQEEEGTSIANQEKGTFDPYAADIWTLAVCLWLLMFQEYPFVVTKIRTTKKGNDLTECPLNKKKNGSKTELLEEKNCEQRFIANDHRRRIKCIEDDI